MRHPIAIARQAKGLNQVELARAVGVEAWQISGWEAGQGYPPPPVAVRIARRLQLRLADVYVSVITAEERAESRGVRDLQSSQQRKRTDHVLAQIPGPDHGAPMELIW